MQARSPREPSDQVEEELEWRDGAALARSTHRGGEDRPHGRSADARTIAASSRAAPFLSSVSLRLPHFGDCTHDGHPDSHGHSPISRAVSATRSSKRSTPRRTSPTPPGCPSCTKIVGRPVCGWMFVERPPRSQRSHIAYSGSTEISACSAACSVPSRSPPASCEQLVRGLEPEAPRSRTAAREGRAARCRAAVLGQGASAGRRRPGRRPRPARRRAARPRASRAARARGSSSTCRVAAACTRAARAVRRARRARRGRAGARGGSRLGAGRRRPRAASRARARRRRRRGSCPVSSSTIRIASGLALRSDTRAAGESPPRQARPAGVRTSSPVCSSSSGRVVRSRAEHAVVGGRERRLVRRGAQVAERICGLSGSSTAASTAAAKQRLGVPREEAVESVRGRHVEREALTAAARSSPLLPQARDRAGEADGDRAVEQADVDAELERVGRRHAEQLARHEIALDRAALLGGVARAIGREPAREVRAPGRLERLARDPEDDLDARGGCGRSRSCAGPRSRASTSSPAASASVEPRSPVSSSSSGRLPERDGARRARRPVLATRRSRRARSGHRASSAGFADGRRREQERRRRCRTARRRGAAGAGRARRGCRRRRGRRAPRRPRRA